MSVSESRSGGRRRSARGGGHGDEARVQEGQRREGGHKYWIALLRWFLLGGTGSHHFYLKRDFQAFLWSISFGGFGIGLLYDLFRLGTYLDEANKSSVFLNTRRQLLHAQRKPPLLSVRVVGQIVFACYLRLALYWAIPHDTRFPVPWAAAVSGTLAGLVAAWTAIHIGDLGYRGGANRVAVGAALVMEALLASACLDEGGEVDQVEYGNVGSSLFVAFAATAGYAWGRRYCAPTEIHCAKSESWLWRQLRCFALVATFWFAVASGIFFHIRIEVEGREDTVAGHFVAYLESPHWQELRQALWLFYVQCSENFDECRDQILDAISAPSARADTALETLGLNSGATLRDIKSAYRSAARHYHPDKCQTEQCKAKFMDIQKAYEYLMGYHGRHSK